MKHVDILIWYARIFYIILAEETRIDFLRTNCSIIIFVNDVFFLESIIIRPKNYSSAADIHISAVIVLNICIAIPEPA